MENISPGWPHHWLWDLPNSFIITLVNKWEHLSAWRPNSWSIIKYAIPSNFHFLHRENCRRKKNAWGKVGLWLKLISGASNRWTQAIIFPMQFCSLFTSTNYFAAYLQHYLTFYWKKKRLLVSCSYHCLICCSVCFGSSWKIIWITVIFFYWLLLNL